MPLGAEEQEPVSTEGKNKAPYRNLGLSAHMMH